jgi:hypothetical protein
MSEKNNTNQKESAPVKQQKLVYVSNRPSMPLDTHTEYNDHYQKVSVPIVRGKAAQQELAVGGEFYGSTEKYVL